MPKFMRSLAQKIASLPKRSTEPLWKGPEADGVTQSMLAKWLVCRERFRVTHVLGLQSERGWDRKTGYGDMWHVCEESLARYDDSGDRFSIKDRPWEEPLAKHVHDEMTKWPLDRAEIDKWHNVCLVQFPEYVQHWMIHPDELGRTPLMQERVFDVPYKLSSGRTIRLRGKFDSVDLVDASSTHTQGVWLKENKTKGDVDEQQLRRQLKFDLQTMFYLVALRSIQSSCLDQLERWIDVPDRFWSSPILGVRYNVVRRPLSGGKGTIVQKKGSKNVPAETKQQYYNRLRDDYIAKEPEQWFFRWKVSISDEDVARFEKEFLRPALEQLCWWYDGVVGVPPSSRTDWKCLANAMNYRMPFGVYSPLLDGGETEVDKHLSEGTEVGLRRVDKLFKELET